MADSKPISMNNGPDVGPEDDRPDESDIHAWEEIEAGRYMPRRIRGSFRGRSLG